MKDSFPILNSKPKEYIPLYTIKPHEEQAIINHGQTLIRLSERGGLSWEEVLCVLEDREFNRDKKAKEKVIEIVKGN